MVIPRRNSSRHYEYSTEEDVQVTYAVALWLLQERAGLTYREARVLLAGFRNENTCDLVQGLGITDQAVYNLKQRAKNKIAASKMTEDEILSGYFPHSLDVSEPGPLF